MRAALEGLLRVLPEHLAKARHPAPPPASERVLHDHLVPAKHLLAWLADRLADGFFAAQGERQARFAKGEATVRRNVARRERREADASW